MNKYKVDSTYRQFYIADVGVEQEAPDQWNDEDVARHFNALENIVALVTEGDATARIFCCAPGQVSSIEDEYDFEAITEVEIPTGTIGIYEWPWEKLEEHIVKPGQYKLRYRGYKLSKKDEEQDYYVLEIQNA